MLSLGDTVFLDGQERLGLQGKRWKVIEARRTGPLGGGRAKVEYRFEGWPDPTEWVPSTRISAQWVET